MVFIATRATERFRAEPGRTQLEHDGQGQDIRKAAVRTRTPREIDPPTRNRALADSECINAMTKVKLWPSYSYQRGREGRETLVKLPLIPGMETLGEVLQQMRKAVAIAKRESWRCALQETSNGSRTMWARLRSHCVPESPKMPPLRPNRESEPTALLLTGKTEVLRQRISLETGHSR